MWQRSQSNRKLWFGLFCVPDRNSQLAQSQVTFTTTAHLQTQLTYTCKINSHLLNHKSPAQSQITCIVTAHCFNTVQHCCSATPKSNSSQTTTYHFDGVFRTKQIINCLQVTLYVFCTHKHTIHSQVFSSISISSSLTKLNHTWQQVRKALCSRKGAHTTAVTAGHWTHAELTSGHALDSCYSCCMHALPSRSKRNN